MLRRLFAFALVLSLAGCATYETRYYDDYGDGYYAATDDGYGDYYVGQPRYRYVDRYDYPGYLAWPAYHSMFWGISRWYYDPFYYPGYYYGVTYFPRGYFSWSSGWTRYRFDVSHRYFPYSPYRYAWYDHYYDWEPWYRTYPSHRYWHPEPRYGSARNEAERLAWESRERSRGPRYRDVDAARYARDPRGADYRSRTGYREDPRVGAFGPDPRDRVRRAGRDASRPMEQRSSYRERGAGPRPGSARDELRGRPDGSARSPTREPGFVNGGRNQDPTSFERPARPGVRDPASTPRVDAGKPARDARARTPAAPTPAYRGGYSGADRGDAGRAYSNRPPASSRDRGLPLPARPAPTARDPYRPSASPPPRESLRSRDAAPPRSGIRSYDAPSGRGDVRSYEAPAARGSVRGFDPAPTARESVRSYSPPAISREPSQRSAPPMREPPASRGGNDGSVRGEARRGGRPEREED